MCYRPPVKIAGVVQNNSALVKEPLINSVRPEP
jgi:hypothetical protein